MLSVGKYVEGALLIAGVLFAYRQPIAALLEQWDASPMYSHAYAVPFICLWLLWAMRDRFAAIAPAPARVSGASVLLLALLMLAAGQVAAIQILQQLSLIVAVAGVTFFLFGFRYLQIASPAIAYLLFMVPIWDVFTEPLHQPFQHNSARLGVALMQLVGVPAHREGILITLPNIVLEVAKACSGVNYLVAVLALALPLAMIRLDTWPRRLILVASAMVISALANSLRVALIGVLAYLEIGSPLHGPMHVLHGLFVAGVGYVALFVGLSLLERKEQEESPVPATGRQAVSWASADALAITAAFLIVGLTGLAPSTSPVALARPLNGFSGSLGDWVAEPAFVEPASVTTAWSDADEQFRRAYRQPEGKVAGVSIWYFSKQAQSKEVVSFKVADLHRRSQRRSITLPDGTSLKVNVVSIPDSRQLAVFWYEVGGAPEAGQLATKARSMWSVLRSGRSNAAAIMLTATAEQGDDEAVLTALDTLATEVHTSLAGHWPHGA